MRDYASVLAFVSTVEAAAADGAEEWRVKRLGAQAMSDVWMMRITYEGEMKYEAIRRIARAILAYADGEETDNTMESMAELVKAMDF